MKKLAYLPLFFAPLFSAQIQDYKYIAVPSEMKDFRKNDYGLPKILKQKLNAKNYAVLEGKQQEWPAEAQNNCNVLSAEIANSSSLLKNKITVNFSDCNGRQIASFTGASNDKDYDTGYPDALNKALANLPESKPVQKDFAKTEAPTIAETPAKTEPNSTTNSKAEIYSNGTISLSRINLNSKQFILSNASSSVPFATFTQSGKREVYHCKLENGNFALGYFDGNDLIIEIPTNDGNFARTVYTRAK
ncbi:hypothetical protein IMZ16_09215 [Cruoricaptor ignavus]|uniref:Uncharacterized protein n=1 Tax=Cruoricaptor ignavus TaxID=1118202 RepID=A0A7M1T1E8_9FLAO|nr:hypothetical protein [Cruoricaptor ignavus]QOR73678.1 hypothetical protein IMZ16_09215 [Cruoricaptor ignavus]